MQTMLICDSSQLMRISLKNLLLQNGYQVVAEPKDGNETIEKYKELSPDIVLLDIAIPKLNGLSVLKMIKIINSAAVVIMCSASENPYIVTEALKNGAKDFIVKPYFDTLVPVLKKLE